MPSIANKWSKCGNSEVNSNNSRNPRKGKEDKNFKMGIFHIKKGVLQTKVLPDRSKLKDGNICLDFCSQGKYACMPIRNVNMASTTLIVIFSANKDKTVLLKHFVKTGNMWINKETSKKHKHALDPKYYKHLLGYTNDPRAKRPEKSM